MSRRAAKPQVAGAEGAQAAVHRRGLLLVLSSPSGAGKSTISRALLEQEDNLTLSISVTTRPKRPAETDGVHYSFIDKARFAELVEQDALLEHAEVFGNRYGTPRAAVEAALDQGRDVLFDIDWQGTQQIAGKLPGDLVRVFILPPSLEELEARLKRRAQDTDEEVRRRMAEAASEMSHWPEYDYILVNHDIDDSVAKVRAIVAAERLRRERQIGLTDFVASLKPRA